MVKDYSINSANNQNWLKGIGLFQFIGGALGILFPLLFIISFFISNGIAGAFSAPNLLISLLFFGFSIYAGIQTYQLRRNCLKLTTINQLLQVFSFFIAPYAYKYTSGICANLSLDFSQGFNIGISTNISVFEFLTNNFKGEYLFQINILAIFIIYKIEKIKTEMKIKVELQESIKNKTN